MTIHCQEFHQLAMDYRGASVHFAPAVYMALVKFIDNRAAAAPAAVVQAEPSEADVSYELIQDDSMVAGTSGDGAYAEILRYAAQYVQDGPVEIVKCVRTNLKVPA